MNIGLCHKIQALNHRPITEIPPQNLISYRIAPILESQSDFSATESISHGGCHAISKISRKALLSNDGCIDVFDMNPALRLAISEVNRRQEMSDIIAMKGHTFHVETGDKTSTEVYLRCLNHDSYF